MNEKAFYGGNFLTPENWSADATRFYSSAKSTTHGYIKCFHMELASSLKEVYRNDVFNNAILANLAYGVLNNIHNLIF